jgi:hypothetical protein
MMWVRTRDGEEVQFQRNRPHAGVSNAWFDRRDGSEVCLDLDDLDESDAATAAWIEGFVSGREPTWADFLGEPDYDDEDLRNLEVGLFALFRRFVEEYRRTRTYRLEHGPWPLPSPPSESPEQPWTILGALRWEWSGEAWHLARADTLALTNVLPGSECERLDDHLDLWTDDGGTRCTRCGYIPAYLLETEQAE